VPRLSDYRRRPRGIHRRWLAAVCALAAFSLVGAAPQPWETNHPKTPPGDGTILRLVSGMVGLTPLPDVPEVIPPGEQLTPGEAAEGRPRGPLAWTDPHTVGSVAVPTDDAFSVGPPGLGGPMHDRNIGQGEPLVGTSWLNRPLHAGWFAGLLVGDQLIDGRLGQEAGFFGGYRFGWDWDHYWGVETRAGGAALTLNGSAGLGHRTSDVLVWDVSAMYYPWGDSRWRPYFSAGLGVASFDFHDEFDDRHNESTLGTPLAMGLKYRWHEWLVLRMDLVDNIAFGRAGLETMHNVSFTTGVEVRFGGVRQSYWPWNPNRHIW